MNRRTGLALLALGCALAAAAAGTGPYLAKHETKEVPALTLMQRAARERQRRLLQQGGGVRPITWFEIVMEAVFLAVIAFAVLYLLFRAAVLLRRLAALRLARSRGRVGTEAYDRGEESDADAVTELRRRVADELTALSADLDEVPEAREAVIACYVRMERAFADAGAARRPDESPMELLARVLDELSVPEADVRRLTALFSEARFSAHPVTDEMRDAARRSLDSVAGALRVPA